MHIHHQPPDIRGLHLIALGAAIVVAEIVAAMTAFEHALGG